MPESDDWIAVIPSYMRYYNNLYYHLDDDIHFLIFVEGKTDPDHLYTVFTKKLKKDLIKDYTFDIKKKDIFYDFSNKFNHTSLNNYGMFKDEVDELPIDLDNSLKHEYESLKKDYEESNKSEYRNYDFVINCLKEWNLNKRILSSIECFGIIDQDSGNHLISGIDNLTQTKYHDLETSCIRHIFTKYITTQIRACFSSVMSYIIKSNSGTELIRKLSELNIHNVLKGRISKYTSKNLFTILGYASENELYISMVKDLKLGSYDSFTMKDSKKIYDYLNEKFYNCYVEKVKNVLLFTTKQGIAEIASFDYGYDSDITWITHGQFKNPKKRNELGVWVVNPNHIIALDFNSNLDFEMGDKAFLIHGDYNIYSNDAYKHFLDSTIIKESNILFSKNLRLDENTFNKYFGSLVDKWLNFEECSCEERNLINVAIDEVFRISNGHFILHGLCNVFNIFQKNFQDEESIFNDICRFFDSSDIRLIYKYSPFSDFKSSYDDFRYSLKENCKE